ncbi:hypothetical protein CFC21_039855 [Triticum aestivum]|uniref:DUF4220 domain-containing protein n=2 Tax=Triticum aestivum TaxID=4565 RepID=A0A9R1FH87_WHEAT|nr:hypothetical protein CFC21_039849 [Triticum aestivum]KAF7027857.1 hypothetical protein CFC21_039855 [Triticum aestivum]CDM81318.1 unnamed protein product [Triticum aestivum]
MGLSSDVQWWEEWQLRILVLGSLFLQLLLYFSDYVRTRPLLRKFRVLVWMAYIGSDALAIYALATLFNRQKQWTADGGSTALEVVWAPVLLIHLGGQMAITAYSLEDNELWRRHAVTLVSQVTVALYVFFKWWSGEKRLLAVAAMLFVSGIIKFSHKPWALQRASFNSMLEGIAIDPRRQVPADNTCWTFCTSDIIFKQMMSTRRRRSAGGEEEQEEELDILLEEYVQKAQKHVQVQAVGSDQDEDYESTVMDYMHKMFVDMSATYSDRLTMLRPFLTLDEKSANYTLQMFLGYIFQILYSKSRSLRSILTFCVWGILVPCLALASLVLFAVTHKDGYSDKDVRVTYILLCCNAVLELLPYLYAVLQSSLELLPCLKNCLRNCLDWIIAITLVCLCTTYVGEDRVSQHSLLSSVARTKKPTILMELATFICLRRYINKHWYIGQVDASRHITGLLLGHMKDGWKEYISDAASYRRFSNLRGQWTLHRLGLERGQRQGLAWSFKVAFDRSVLLWHIATDLCFHHPNTSSTRGDAAATQHSREMSNYMIYLLCIRPEMLLPGTSPGLFDVASDALEDAFKGSKALLHKEETLALEIMDMGKSSSATAPAPAPGNLIPSACRLAEALMGLDDEEKRWRVIQGVWVEMLCYSAARCRGYLHAKSLGEGVEYLSYVWLLWSFMGMETLADKFQKPEEPPEALAEEEIAPATRASPSPPEAKQTEEEISSPV